MDKKYTDKFIPLKDEEVNALSKLTNKSTFEELKKVGEMKKVLETIKEIYKLKISPRSLRYLKILSTVRKFQLNAFKDLAEIKKLLAKNIKEKLKSKRGGRAMKGKSPRDTVDKVIAESTKKEDPLTKLMKDILKSKSTNDLEKAIKDYANIFCQSGVQNLIKSNALGKVFTGMFTVIKQNVNNAIFEGKIGFDNSGWNASKEFMNILTTGLACLTQLKPVFDFFKSLFKKAFRIVTTPFRRGDRPPNGAGRGDGPDDDDGPPQPPSSFDRQQRNVLNELFRKQQQSIEAGIVGASGGGSQQPPPPATGGTQQPPIPPATGGTQQPPPPSGFSFSDYFSNLFGGSTQGGPSEDDRAGDPTNDAGSGAVAIIPQATRRRIIPEPFAPSTPAGYPIPPIEPLPYIQPPGMPPQNEPWDPYNILAGAAFLYEAGRYFTNPTPPTGGPPPMEPPQDGGEQLPAGPVGENEFEREQFEMEEAERARQDAERDDEEDDLKAIMPPPSSVEVAGSLFGGSKFIPASSYDAVRAAQLASKIFNQMAGAVNKVDTIDESVELKDALTNQQVIEFDIQNQLIRQMVQPANESILQEEMILIEGLVQDSFEIIQSIENGSMELNDGLEILQSTADYITDVLARIPKGEDEEEVSRLRILRANIIQSRNDLTNKGVDKVKLQTDLLNQREAGVASIERSVERKQNIVKDLQDQREIARDRAEEDTRRNLSSIQTENYMNRERKRILDSVLDSGVGHSQAISSLERLSNMYMAQLNREQQENMNRNIREAIETINRSRRIRGTQRGETLSSLQSQIVPNIRNRITQAENVRNLLLDNLQRRKEKMKSVINQMSINSKKQMKVSPTLAGLPLPYRPQRKGGALVPSRDSSFDTLYTDTSVPQMGGTESPLSGGAERRATPEIREQYKIHMNQSEKKGRGQPKAEFNRFFGFTTGSGTKAENTIKKLFKFLFGSADVAIEIIREFRKLYGTPKTLNATHRDYYMYLINNYIGVDK